MNSTHETELVNLREWISAAESRGAIAVLAHRNGDMDTIASALGMASSIGVLAKGCGLHLCALARDMLKIENLDFMLLDADRVCWPNPLGGVIIVDAGSESQLGLTLPSGVPKCVIDHHSTSDWKKAAGDLLINWDVRATVQIVQAYITRYTPDALDESIARVLLAGLLTDTGRFRHGDGPSLAAAAELVESHDLDLKSIVEFIEQRRTDSAERIAVLKALGRLKYTRIGDLLVATCRASIHEATVCRALLTAGADVAFAISLQDEGLRLTSRAIDAAVKSGIDLGRLASGLATRFGGEGGGHDGAAGWQGDVEMTELESACHNLLGEQYTG